MAKSKGKSSKSTKKAVTKASKVISKTAKNNPAAVIVIIIVAILLAGLGIGGYLAYKHFNPDYTFKLNGTETTYVSKNSSYEEKGAVATYAGKDISNEIKISYFDEAKNAVTGITTDVEATFYVEYKIDHEKLNKTLKRTVIVSDVVDMSIYFLELGNEYTGDSTYIKAGDVDILIDAGSRNASAGTIKAFVDEHCTDGKLEYVIVTHAHQDHIAGFVGTSKFPGIFDSYVCETIIDFSLTNATSAVYNNYVAKRDAEVSSGAKHYTALECVKQTNGAQKIYTIAPGITMEILYQEFYEKKTSDENDYSVCTLFTQGSNHYLLTGDLEKDGEKSLVENNPTLPKVQLFKGAHHGSYTANTDTLLSVIQPEVVCICCCAGSTEYTKTPENTFPAQAAINRLGKYTDKIYVTTVTSSNSDKHESMNGNILFFCASGSSYTVTGSNNNTILKDTEWFKANRTWPSV